MAFEKVTESDSTYRHLEKMSVSELLIHINEEDKKVFLNIGAWVGDGGLR